MPTIPESHKDLLATQICILSTIGPDGRPQTSPVWFLADGDTVRVSLNTARQKVKNMRARPLASIVILDLANPARYLELRGDVTIEPDDDYEFASRVGDKYGLPDVRVLDGPGETRVCVTMHPTRVHGVDMSR